MAVKRAQRLYHVECDECGAESEASESFHEAVDAFKADGGKIYRNGWNDWSHYCRLCRNL